MKDLTQEGNLMCSLCSLEANKELEQHLTICFYFSFQSLNVNTSLCIGCFLSFFRGLWHPFWTIGSRNECAFLVIDFAEVIVMLLNSFICIILTVHLDTGYSSILWPANCKYNLAFYLLRYKFVKSVAKTVLLLYRYNILTIYNKHELIIHVFFSKWHVVSVGWLNDALHGNCFLREICLFVVKRENATYESG